MVTALITLILVAGLGVRVASRWLPERQPNALADEYSTYLRSASRQPISWVPLSRDAFERAKQEGKLVLVAITSEFSRESRLMDLDQFTDPEFAFLVNSHYIAVRVDAFEAPGFVREVTLNSLMLEATGGALFLALDADGNLLSMSGPQPLRTSGNPPGLIDWLGDLKRDYAAREPRIRAQAIQLNQERERLLSLTDPQNTSLRDALALGLESVRASLNPMRSGLRDAPSMIAAPMLALLLLSGGSNALPADGAGEWLLRLRESACYDQVFGGFFVRSRGRGWADPDFGKLAGRSAQLAVVYAKASLVYDAPLFRQTAQQTLDWILLDVRDPTTGLFYLGVPVSLPADEDGVPYVRLASESGRLTALFPDAGSGAYRLASAPSFQAGVGQERVNQIASDLKQLSAPARRYSPPPPSPELYAENNGMVIAALFAVGRLLDEPRYIAAGQKALASARRVFLLSGDVSHAARGRFHQTGYLGGYVWLARAFWESYLSTGNRDDLKQCTQLLHRALQLFGEEGRVWCNLRSRYDFLAFVSGVEPVGDSPDEALVAVLLRTLVEAGRVVGDNGLVAEAQRIAQRYASVPARLGPAGAGLLVGLSALLEPVVVVKGKDAEVRSAAYSRRFPVVCCAPLPPDRPGMSGLSDGAYAIGPDGIRRIVEAAN